MPGLALADMPLFPDRHEKLDRRRRKTALRQAQDKRRMQGRAGIGRDPIEDSLQRAIPWPPAPPGTRWLPRGVQPGRGFGPGVARSLDLEP